MAKTMSKTEKRIWGIVFLAPFVILILAMFPIIHFDGRLIFTFGPDRIGSGGVGFDTRVFGSHTLETEYGEIRLRNFAHILSRFGTVAMIFDRTFERGRASHNLVVEGIVIPQNIQVTFNVYTQQIRTLTLAPSGLVRDFQEVEVSGIPFTVGRIDFNPRFSQQGGGTADILTYFFASGYVTLADGAQIYFPLFPDGSPMSRGLYIDKDDERWRIFTRTAYRTLLRLPGETEFAEYREITFRPHWGEFIEGVRVE